MGVDVYDEMWMQMGTHELDGDFGSLCEDVDKEQN